MYDFDTITDRNTQDDIKYQKIEGIDDLIPMWVADMDFKCPQEVSDALVKIAQNGIFGYSEAGSEYDEAVISWFKRRYDWDVKPEEIIPIPSVILSISYAVRALTEEGDHVLIFEPVYGPFERCVEGNGRKLTISELKNVNGRYEFDLKDVEEKIRKDNVKLLLWCSPHNPGGRVWTYEELKTISDLCLKYGVFIVSDEIHADLVLGGRQHIPMSKISSEVSHNCIVLSSPTKTFNLAGIQAANIVSENKEALEKIDQLSFVTGAFGLNKMAIAATIEAYNHGEAWLDELLEYIEGNVDLVINELQDTDLVVMKPEGTYLVWIDCRKHENFSETLLKKAHVRVSEGEFFGRGGDGFIRLNVACPRSIVREALGRIKGCL